MCTYVVTVSVHSIYIVMADNITESQSQIPNRSVIDVTLNDDVTSNDDKVVHDIQGAIESKEVRKGLIIMLHFNYKGLARVNSNTLFVSVSLSFISVYVPLSLSLCLSPSQDTQEGGDVVTQTCIKAISNIQELIDDLQSSSIQVTAGTLTIKDCQGNLLDYCHLLVEGAKVYVT